MPHIHCSAFSSLAGVTKPVIEMVWSILYIYIPFQNGSRIKSCFESPYETCDTLQSFFFTGYTLRHCHTRICAENSTQGPHRGTLHFESFVDQLGINHYNRALQPGVGTPTFCSSPVYRQLTYAAWENSQNLVASNKKKKKIV